MRGSCSKVGYPKGMKSKGCRGAVVRVSGHSELEELDLAGRA